MPSEASARGDAVDYPLNGTATSQVGHQHVCEQEEEASELPFGLLRRAAIR
jgi:hypothetical protein